MLRKLSIVRPVKRQNRTVPTTSVEPTLSCSPSISKPNIFETFSLKTSPDRTGNAARPKGPAIPKDTVSQHEGGIHFDVNPHEIRRLESATDSRASVDGRIATVDDAPDEGRPNSVVQPIRVSN